MTRSPLLMHVLAAALLAGLVGCSQAPVAAHPRTPPAVVEPGTGGAPGRITLTAQAAQRIGLKTVAVAAAPAGSSATASTMIPYGAVLYDAFGKTWAYVNPEGLVFVRQPITVRTIEGDAAFLTDGPPPGTLVVSVGVAELFGTETGLGH